LTWLQRSGVAAAPRMACLFLHGMGIRHTGTPLLLNGFHKGSLGDPRNVDDLIKTLTGPYWGFGPKSAFREPLMELCDAYFLRADTVSHGWDDNYLQDSYCAAIGTLSNTYDGVAVFTHSLANLVVSGGVLAQKNGCDRIAAKAALFSKAKNALWFGLAPPLGGSEATTFVQDVMHGKFNPLPGPLMSTLKKYIAHNKADEDTGNLLPTANSLQPGYVTKKSGGSVSNVQMHCNQPAVQSWAQAHADYRCTEVRDIHRKFVSRSVCGVSASGLGKSTKFFIDISKQLGAVMSRWAGQKSVDGVNLPYLQHWKRAISDSMVPADSCYSGHNPHSTQGPDSDYYIANLNHGDVTGANGDGGRPDQKPNAWIINAVHLTTKWASGGAHFLEVFDEDIEDDADVDADQDQDQDQV